MPKPKLMLTTDMADTAVARDLPLLKLIPMLKPKLTVVTDTVDTDMEVMEVTDMVDTVARGPLMPMLRLTMVDTMVDTDMADTDTVDTVMVDTVMVVVTT